MLKLLRYLKGYYVKAALAPFFKLFEAISELIVPMLIAAIIDNGIATGDTDYIIKYCIIVGALALSGLLFATVCQFTASRAAMRLGTRIRADAFKKVNLLSAREVDKIGGASIVTRISSDVTGVQNAFGMFLRLVMRTPFIVIGAIALAMVIDPVFSAIFIPATILLVVVLYFVMKKCSPHFKTAQKKLDNVSHATRETLTGARVIRAFSNEQKESEKFAVAADDCSDVLARAGRISALSSPLTFAVVNLGVICVLWFGGVRVNAGGLTQGEITALVNYLMQIFLAVTAFANIILTFTRASACASRVNAVLDAEPSVKDEGAETPSDADTVLEFKNVSFAYDGENDLEGASFTLKKGGTLGIIGGTGSGKSTLVNLIPRLIEQNSGEILFCEKPVNAYSLAALRDSIGFVPQKARLFSGTLMDNLRVAKRDATEDDARRALETAQALELIDRVGFDGVIAEGGKNLSGGQKQRLTIARALMKERKLLILDDSSSALDFATERRLYEALDCLGTTRIIVSQRVSGVRSCDNILVLDEGKTIAYGAHDELLQTCPLYRELYNLQTEATE